MINSNGPYSHVGGSGTASGGFTGCRSCSSEYLDLHRRMQHNQLTYITNRHEKPAGVGRGDALFFGMAVDRRNVPYRVGSKSHSFLLSRDLSGGLNRQPIAADEGKQYSHLRGFVLLCGAQLIDRASC